MTREEFNKNSYLVNNNALYNKHTEHISTTEPIFIDGMAGSDNIVHEREGDVSQNTYWAYEYESGKFLLGKFNEDDIKVECETDSSNLWIVDAEGVYIEKDALNSYMESECLDTINAKYGTSFTALTMQKVTSIAIGDDCPDWDAYEKIVLPPTIYIKTTPTGSSLCTIGKILSNTFKILCQDNASAWQVTNEGIINGVFGNAQLMIEQIWTPKLQQAGYTISSYEIEVVAYNVGDSIEDWNDFTQI